MCKYPQKIINFGQVFTKLINFLVKIKNLNILIDNLVISVKVGYFFDKKPILYIFENPKPDPGFLK